LLASTPTSTLAFGHLSAMPRQWRSCIDGKTRATLLNRHQVHCVGCIIREGTPMRPSIQILVVLFAVGSGSLPRCPRKIRWFKVLIAFASYRDRPKHPNIFFYEHDGIAGGKILAGCTQTGATAEGHPSLSYDNRYCAFTFELENNTGQIYFWDQKEQQLVEHPAMNDRPTPRWGRPCPRRQPHRLFRVGQAGCRGQGWHVFFTIGSPRRRSTCRG